jgi:integrase
VGLFPSVILSDVRSHLDNLTQPEADVLLFTSPTGKLLRHGNFRRRVWLPALAASGVEIHLHDLRHTGNGLVAEAGANLRELMERMGHSTSRAALIYLHSTSERQHTLADAVAARVQVRTRQRREMPDAVARMWHAEKITCVAAPRPAQFVRSQLGFRGRPERDSNARPTA